MARKSAKISVCLALCLASYVSAGGAFASAGAGVGAFASAGGFGVGAGAGVPVVGLRSGFVGGSGSGSGVSVVSTRSGSGGGSSFVSHGSGSGVRSGFVSSGGGGSGGATFVSSDGSGVFISSSDNPYPYQHSSITFVSDERPRQGFRNCRTWCKSNFRRNWYCCTRGGNW